MSNNLSRRGFVKGAACGAAGALAASMCGVVYASESEVTWDAEYDVVIAGYGATGAVAAIEAADQGAKVLLVEKAPEGREGGCSKVNQQLITCTKDPEEFYAFWNFLRGGFSYPDDDLLRLYTDSAADNWAYLEYLGATPDDLDFHSRGADIDGPGASSVYVTQVTSSYYMLLQANVEKRAESIDVWFESPAVSLIQDPVTKEVQGLVVEKDGALLNIKSKGGVVLATGGFEANQKMVEAFMWCTDTGYYASEYNTGDGVRMSMAAGADLVSMGIGNAFSWGYRAEGSRRGLSFNTKIRDMAIFVTGKGVRFYNERASARRSNLNYSGNWRVPIFPDSAYFICDDNARATAPMFTSFSDDNMAEIEAGIIIKADTIEDLAVAIDMDPETLANTVATFNAAATEDNDPFGRPAGRIIPITQAPFYAVKMSKYVTNTEGGPRRDQASRVIDTNGDPIPGLFAGGCLGCPNVGEDWNCGGNMSEALFLDAYLARRLPHSQKVKILMRLNR